MSDYLPCPFCGGDDLRVVDWADETGEYDAIECSKCLGTAPATNWNQRAEQETLMSLRRWLREKDDEIAKLRRGAIHD